MPEINTEASEDFADRATRAAVAAFEASQPSPATPPKPQPQPAPAANLLFVIDTTATEGPRTHEMPVKGAIQKFTFLPGVPLGMAPEIAAKFLRHDAWKLVDANGEARSYVRAPKQPEELQAGEKLVLTEHETVARFEELSAPAIYQRCVELPGGEKFAEGDKPDRTGMIAFLKADAKSKRNAHKTAPSEIGPLDFVPEAADGHEAAPFDQYAEHRDDDA